MRVGMAAVLCAALLAAGCARPTSGTAVAVREVDPTVTTSAPPEADPDDVRWMEKFCGTGKLLVTAAETTQQPTSSSDPAVLKKQFLDTTGRFIGVLDAALADYRSLVPSPAPEIDPNLGKLIDGLAQGRSAVATARDEVTAAEPLTPEVYGSAIDRFGTGLRGFEAALTAVDNIELPDRLRDAAAATENCEQGGAAPPTTR